MVVRDVKKQVIQETFEGQPNFPFSAGDRVVLERYFPITEMISRCCGSGCEVLIYSYEDFNKAIIKIINGHVSGRCLGNPITEFGLNVAKAAIESDEDITGPYLARTKSGSLLKCISMVIRNEKKQPIGALGINIDLSIPMERFVKDFLLSIDQSGTADEVLASDLGEKVATLVAEELEAFSRITGVSPSKKNRNIVTALNKRGIFDVKGSVELVAGELGVTKHTIYKYLREIMDNG
jgi:predicted transcriptional regulator YheO